jgi:hypothetical protein
MDRVSQQNYLAATAKEMMAVKNKKLINVLHYASSLFVFFASIFFSFAPKGVLQ